MVCIGRDDSPVHGLVPRDLLVGIASLTYGPVHERIIALDAGRAALKRCIKIFPCGHVFYSRASVQVSNCIV